MAGRRRGSVDRVDASLVGAAERTLGHPVQLVLAEDARPVAAASVVGGTGRMRVAWLDPTATRVLARVGCPPLRPSRFRPVVACSITLVEHDGIDDRVLVARVAPGVAAVRPLIGVEEGPVDVALGPSGLALVRVPLGAVVIGVDALSATGEPLGRLLGPGVADLRLENGSVGGRLGTSHGMAAGFGAGIWVDDLASAETEAGFRPDLPEWLPEGLVMGRPHIEPDVSYPAAPPAVAIAWTGPGESRVLVRQAVAPLAMPDAGGAPAREVDVGGARALLRGRWMPTVVWETAERAYGVQVRRTDDGEAVALRVARSIGGQGGPPAD